MRKTLMLAIVSIIALGMAYDGSYGASSPIMAHQYNCTSNNQSLNFVMYEQDGRIYGGHMYLEDLQIANLVLDSIKSRGNLLVRVAGNPANVQLGLYQDRVNVIDVATRTESGVCKSSYSFR